MPLYSQREYVKSFVIRRNGNKIYVLAFIQYDDAAKLWAIDYCDKVTKETLSVDLPPIQQPERTLAIIQLQSVINANK